MWPSYIEVIKAKAPQTTLVFDKFYIVRQLPEAVDKVRRQEVNDKKAKNKGVLAGIRYIWLKNPWNLTDKQKSSLSFLETLNLKIHRAYSFRSVKNYIMNLYYCMGDLPMPTSLHRFA